MLIQCWQQKVKDVTLGRKLTSCPYGLVLSDALHVTFQRGKIDVFDAYYNAARTSETAFQKQPHYLFANIKRFEDVEVFLKRFGLPVSQGGREILLGEFLVEAKRLLYAMKAWASVRDKAWTCARESLAELSFARGNGAHWYFWPPTIYDIAENHEFTKRKEQFRRSIEQQRPGTSWMAGSHERAEEMMRLYEAIGLSDYVGSSGVAPIRQNRLKEPSPNDVFTTFVNEIQSLCVEPLRWVEITPELHTIDPKGKAKERRLKMCWNLNPIEFLGEEERGDATSSYEACHFATPYFLMFLHQITQGSEIRVCADPRCQSPFEVKRRNQRFCGQACAHRTASRDYRKRQAKPPVERSLLGESEQ
jgi:hypothetical protein